MGSGSFATVSKVEFQTVSAAGGPTIYCDPGCTDDGGNTNIVFGPAPASPTTTPPDLSDAVRAITTALARVLGVMVVLVAIVALFTFITTKTNSTIRDGFGSLGGRKGG